MLDPDPLAGTRYRALEVLGAGAMGDVFLAENVALQNKVVVKVIKAELAKSPELIDRMRLEAQTAARVSHPNVVRVLDFATTDTKRPYVVMEYLVGHTLRQEVKQRGALPTSEAIDLTRQLLSGLAAVHDLGVVHRDLKPANIFLCGGGDTPRILKIIDFGIAKVTSSAGNAPAPLAQPTAEGFALGTPRFFSPEQALGFGIGPTSDIYSVGALLFWMLTGSDPFHDRKEVLEIMKAHLQTPPPAPSTLNPAVPADLDQIVMKALAKKPADRFSTAHEFALALAAPLGPVRRWPKTEIVDTRAVRQAVASPASAPRVVDVETDPMPTLAIRAAAKAQRRAPHLPSVAEESTTAPLPALTSRHAIAPGRSPLRNRRLLVVLLVLLVPFAWVSWMIVRSLGL